MSKAKKQEEHQEPSEAPEQVQQEAKQEAKLTSEQLKIQELTDTLQRLQADFENYKKRVDKETKEFITFANASLISKFLPMLDTLDVAIKNATKDNQHPQYVKGLELLHAQLMSVLRSEGLLPIICEGKKFDPHYHEVLLKEASGKEDGTILEEFQKGYLLHKKILRHSKVKISGK